MDQITPGMTYGLAALSLAIYAIPLLIVAWQVMKAPIWTKIPQGRQHRQQGVPKSASALKLGQRDELSTIHCLMLPVLSTERIAHLATAQGCCAAASQSSLCR
jgi:hypothetical protein